MALVVNSNISSLTAQRQLGNSGMELDKASERLATGKRINGAADDAAGLAISNRQTSQIRGLDQAIRNSNDGISLIQTAEGALDETTNILQRMRELAVQSSNGIYSDTDRATIDAEVQQLKQEIDRIAETTSFNGQNVLDGSLGEVALQVGSEADQTVSFTIGTLDADSLGGTAAGDIVGTVGTAALATGLAILGNAATDTMLINGQDVGVLTDAAVGAALKGKIEEINKNVSGVEASAFVEMTATADGSGIIRGTDHVEVVLALQDGTSTTLQITDTGSMDEFVDAVNAAGGDNVSASLNDDGKLVLTSETAASITVNESGGTSLTQVGVATTTAREAQLAFEITDNSVDDIDITFGAGLSSAEILGLGVQERTDGDITASVITAFVGHAEGDLVLNDVEIGAISAGTNATTKGDSMVLAINKLSDEHGVVASNNAGILTLNSVSGEEVSISYSTGAAGVMLANTGLMETNSAASQGNAVADIDISTLAGAQSAIDTIDTALDQINTVRADMGAVNNRLDFTISNLSNVSENTSAARSRIVDADFAAETANLSRSQVLQQASQAMLAQANARPQQVLSLLQ